MVIEEMVQELPEELSRSRRKYRKIAHWETRLAISAISVSTSSEYEFDDIIESSPSVQIAWVWRRAESKHRVNFGVKGAILVFQVHRSNAFEVARIRAGLKAKSAHTS